MDTQRRERKINNPFPGEPQEIGCLQGQLFYNHKLLHSQEHATQTFLVQWDADHGFLSISHRIDPARILWSTVPHSSFVSAALGEARVEECRGSFCIHDKACFIFWHQTVTQIELKTGAGQIVISGRLYSDQDDAHEDVHGFPPLKKVSSLGSMRMQQRMAVPYFLIFTEVCDNQLEFHAFLDRPPEASMDSDNFKENQENATPQVNRVQISYASEENERFFGFGEQFSYFDLKGKKVPILVQEQGLGRGDQPMSIAANLVSYRSAGSWHTSYAPVPHYMTSKMRSLFLENYEYSVFDLTQQDRVHVQVHAGWIKGRIIHGRNPLELIERYTATIGRMRALPDWILCGAVVGMQGGTDKVRTIMKSLKKHKVPLAAFWLQDWVGQRRTSVGQQLWWNWEVDAEHYSAWEELVKDLGSQGVQTMTYLNPCLASVRGKHNKKRDLLNEACKMGLTVKDHHEEPYMIKNTDFDAAMVDLTNPMARRWLMDIMRDMVKSGVKGWMADFGEALPFDSLLFSGENSEALHNKWPELWAETNRQFVEEWEMEHKGDNEQLLFFMRAGFRSSPKWSLLFWEGDQMVSWQRNDGIKSAITGLLSSGISGYSFNHSDIGGYTTVNAPFIRYVRSKELLYRWMELNAFSVIFRTHEGNDPEANTQFYSSDETLQHFSRCANLYKAWEFYRKQLVKEAAAFGWPVVRHLFLHYPQDTFVQKIIYEQFLVGSDILVAPVLNKGQDGVWTYFPPGEEWEHIWTKNVFTNKVRQKIWVKAPIGFPAVFVKLSSPIRSILLENLVSLRLTEELYPA